MTMRNMRMVLSQRVARIVPITNCLYWSKNVELLESVSRDVDWKKNALLGKKQRRLQTRAFSTLASKITCPMGFFTFTSCTFHVTPRPHRLRDARTRALISVEAARVSKKPKFKHLPQGAAVDAMGTAMCANCLGKGMQIEHWCPGGGPPSSSIHTDDHDNRMA